MILKQGDVLNSNAEILLFTSNSVKNSKGELIMGKGNALAFKKQFPFLPLVIGDLIKEELYGFIEVPNCGLGCFQTKIHWSNPSTVEIIKFSTEKLLIWMDDNKYTDTIAMPFPGIGNGGLRKEEVTPIISSLPDNVSIYTM